MDPASDKRHSILETVNEAASSIAAALPGRAAAPLLAALPTVVPFVARAVRRHPVAMLVVAGALLWASQRGRKRSATGYPDT